MFKLSPERWAGIGQGDSLSIEEQYVQRSWAGRQHHPQGHTEGRSVWEMLSDGGGEEEVWSMSPGKQQEVRKDFMQWTGTKYRFSRFLESSAEPVRGCRQPPLAQRANLPPPPPQYQDPTLNLLITLFPPEPASSSGPAWPSVAPAFSGTCWHQCGGAMPPPTSPSPTVQSLWLVTCRKLLPVLDSSPFNAGGE